MNLKNFLQTHYLHVAVAAVVIGVALISIPVANTWWAHMLGTSGQVSTGQLDSSNAGGNTTIEAQKSVMAYWKTGNGMASENLPAVVRGEICVHNTGEFGTRSLNILDQVEYLDESGLYTPLDGASKIINPDQQVDPGGMRCYPYEFDFNPRAGVTRYRNIAQVSISNAVPAVGVLSADCSSEGSCDSDAAAQAEFVLDANSPSLLPTLSLATPTAPLIPGAEIKALLDATVGPNGQDMDVSSHLQLLNSGVLPAEGLTLTGQVFSADSNGQPLQAVSSAWNWSSASPMPAGDVMTNYFDLTFTPQSDQHYLVQVQVRIDNYTGWQPGSPSCPGSSPCPYGPDIRVMLTLPGDHPATPTAPPTGTRTPTATQEGAATATFSVATPTPPAWTAAPTETVAPTSPPPTPTSPQPTPTSPDLASNTPEPAQSETPSS